MQSLTSSLQIGARRNFSRAAGTMVADERPWEVALEWLAGHPAVVTSWAVTDGEIIPTPLDEGARALLAYLRMTTRDTYAIGQAIAHLFDHAGDLTHAVWCWQDGETDFFKVEPKPDWARREASH
jgi:hypothetical protein